MIQLKEPSLSKATISIDVVESGRARSRNWLPCRIGENIQFNTSHLESFFFAEWNPVIYDAMLVAAAVEFADKTQRRPALSWRRTIHLNIPVHDPRHWRDGRVGSSLHNVLNFLTGDSWTVEFHAR